jgi:2-polyprenyl-3-methyl-5-hydroxy-6-metoxy-1,4-benzoquinol methylase
MDLVEAEARGFESGVRHPWERARLTLVSALVGHHAQLRSGDAVLDIGCGDTFVVDAPARRYRDASFHAVDSAFTGTVIDLYRSRLTSPNVSLTASLDEVVLTRPAALILLMDVIEHVPDDRAFLNDLLARDIVGPATRILITVPSYPSLFCAHDRFLGHYRRYNRRSLKALFSAVGLTEVEDGHFFISLLPPRLLQVIRERFSAPDADRSTQLATWSGREGTARALAGLLIADGHLSIQLARLGLKLPGLSNFAICRKSA